MYIKRKWKRVVRNIFIASIKEGIPEDKVDERVTAMRELKDKVPKIIQLTVGKSKRCI